MRLLIFVILIFSSVRGSSQEPLKIKIAKSDEKCSATLLGKSGGNISKEELKACHAISVKGPCDYKVVSFLFSCNFSGRLFETSTKDGYFPSEVKSFLMGLGVGDKFFIEKIKVKSNITGQTFSLPSLKFTVVQ
jgi:hypothetical protein